MKTMFSETRNKWSYKITVLDHSEPKFENICDDVFFMDFEFLEKKFGISFSNLHLNKEKNKNTIILKIDQISTGCRLNLSCNPWVFHCNLGICIGNWSCISLLSSEMAYKFEEKDPWKEFFFLDNINLEPGGKIIVLINSYKVLIYGVATNENNEKNAERNKGENNKATEIEALTNKLKLTDFEKMQGNKERESIINEEMKSHNQEKASISLKEGIFSDSKPETKKSADQQEKTNSKRESLTKKPNSETMKHFNLTTLSMENDTDDSADLEMIDRCLKEYYSQEDSKENQPGETIELQTNSCFDYFGNRFDLPELIHEKEKPSRFSAQKSSQKENTPLKESVDKKKRRMTSFGEDDEDYKHFNLKKKKFKFVDSPLTLSKGSSRKKPEENEEKEGEENMGRKLIRLKKIKDIQDENTCPICLDMISQEKGYLTCKHFFCSQCIKDWAEVTNLCPLCKADFHEIEVKNKASAETHTIKVQAKKQRADHYDDELEEYDESDDLCYICDSGENTHLLLVCDACKYFCCHTYCLDPPLNHIPEGEWICTYCQRERENSFSFSFNMGNFFTSRRNNSHHPNTRNNRNTRNNNRRNNNNANRNRNNRGRNNNNNRRRALELFQNTDDLKMKGPNLRSDSDFCTEQSKKYNLRNNIGLDNKFKDLF